MAERIAAVSPALYHQNGDLRVLEPARSCLRKAARVKNSSSATGTCVWSAWINVSTAPEVAFGLLLLSGYIQDHGGCLRWEAAWESQSPELQLVAGSAGFAAKSFSALW